MRITIRFFKSSSKYYDPCCLKCESFSLYSNDKSKNTVVIEDDEIREKRDTIDEVLSIVKNWTKSEYYIGDDKVDSIDIIKLLKLLDCENAKANEIVGDHCLALDGWGCNYLEEIAYNNDEYSYRNKYYWYEFGFFKDNTWMIDKDRIKRILEDEAERKHLFFCRFFDLEKINKEVEKLPDRIEVDENDKNCKWQYKYRKAPAGLNQTEVIGVEPKNNTQFPDHVTFPLGELLPPEIITEEPKKNVPSITFNDIGGIDSIVQQVREVIELPMISPEIFEYYHLTPHKGILLYGPPGCGKTLIAKAIANEIKAHFITVNGPEILNKYLGQSEENLRKIFEEAKSISPSIIYFDEFDSLSTVRDSDDHLSSSTVVNQLLTLLDGMDDKHVCCIASTNRIDMIDEAVKRPGRFDYVIEIEKPSVEGCKAIFKIHTKNMPIEESFDKEKFVEKYLVGLSGAEIAFIASEAAYNSIRRTIDIKRIFSGEEVLLSEDNIVSELDFVQAVKTMKNRKSKSWSAQYRY